MNARRNALQRTRPSPSAYTLGTLWRRVGDAFCSASMRFLLGIIILSVAMLACQSGAKLGDLSRVAEVERSVAQSNWERVEKASKARDHRALDSLVGSNVLVLIDAAGSPWTGKALSIEERAASAGDASRLAGARGELASQIARAMQERRDRAWQVRCTVDFTRKQVRDHFIWPDAVFGADFELLGTITKASISAHSISIKPVAIQRVILQL